MSRRKSRGKAKGRIFSVETLYLKVIKYALNMTGKLEKNPLPLGTRSPKGRIMVKNKIQRKGRNREENR